MHRLLLPVFCALFATLPAIAQTGATDGEWRTYGGDLGARAMRP